MDKKLGEGREEGEGEGIKEGNKGERRLEGRRERDIN